MCVKRFNENFCFFFFTDFNPVETSTDLDPTETVTDLNRAKTETGDPSNAGTMGNVVRIFNTHKNTNVVRIFNFHKNTTNADGMRDFFCYPFSMQWTWV